MFAFHHETVLPTLAGFHMMLRDQSLASLVGTIESKARARRLLMAGSELMSFCQKRGKVSEDNQSRLEELDTFLELVYNCQQKIPSDIGELSKQDLLIIGQAEAELLDLALGEGFPVSWGGRRPASTP